VKRFNLPAIKNDISSYIAKIEKFPTLSAEEEHELIKKFHTQGDIQAAQKLVISNLRFVVKVANEYRKFGFPLTDLIQEGNLGLMKAIKNYDPDKGCKKFISYAVWWIRAQIHEFIMRSWSMVKIGTTQLQKKLFYKFSNLDKDLEENGVFAKQLAEEFHVTEDKIIEIKNRFENSDVSLDTKIKDEEGSSFINLVPSHYQAPDDFAIENEKEDILQEKLYEALKVLNEREKYIILNRYLSEDPKTLQDIGYKFNITRERVRQIEKRALEKMKRVLPDELRYLAA